MIFRSGKRIHLGFPATAEINGGQILRRRRLPGHRERGETVIRRELPDFSDRCEGITRISGESLFNERGDIIGIVTFQTDELSRTAGDNFAFAIPIKSSINKP